MSKIYILLITSIFSNLCAASDLSSEVTYQNGNIRFQVVKQKNKFFFSDNLGERSLEIKNCNRRIVNQFWEELLKNVNSVKGNGISSNSRVPSSSAWIGYEGLRYQVLDFESSVHFFNKVPNNSHVLFAESIRLCKK